ncbi:hypothetical protein BC938DRAFT_472741 [Jimgerdemannia flammicorona]|uniref:MRH domain-containing protein n=1 Tax=Jimgerdemannia flammicorona TaxID=994334 RepID=A0A433Q5H3_9FUNG|nr:hypothetical protein BC938DRAFT_472741 [Jimgerdemannia flammicorona]
MKRDHNQNYHDLAVKSAISGYDELVEEWDKQKDDIKKDLDELDVPDDDDASVSYDEDFLDDDVAEEVAAEEVAAEEVAAGDAAVEDEEVKRTSEGKSPSEPVSGTLSLLGKLSAYVPAFVKDVVQKTTGKVWDSEVKDELSRAQEALNGPQDELNDKLRRLGDVDDKLAKNYGLNQEWAKLEDQCFELNEGEYTYSLCILGQAHQKSNRDHSSTYLGKFSAFTGNSDPISDEHYAKQLYSEGTRCWNGPDRSVKATFECGLTTELFSVTEPEKCEYAFKLRSPAVCPLVVKEGGKPAAAEKSSPAHEEL